MSFHVISMSSAQTIYIILHTQFFFSRKIKGLSTRLYFMCNTLYILTSMYDFSRLHLMWINSFERSSLTWSTNGYVHIIYSQIKINRSSLNGLFLLLILI